MTLQRGQDNVDDKLTEPNNCCQHYQGQGLPKMRLSKQELIKKELS